MFTTEILSESLIILALGWGGIFVVMIVIYLVSLALSKIFAPNDTKA